MQKSKFKKLQLTQPLKEPAGESEQASQEKLNLSNACCQSSGSSDKTLKTDQHVFSITTRKITQVRVFTNTALSPKMVMRLRVFSEALRLTTSSNNTLIKIQFAFKNALSLGEVGK